MDDETHFGQTLRLLLGLSHEATYTPSAREALRWIQEGHRYDAILCDLMMAEMQGEKFCQELAARAPELARRVIFMSGGAYTPDSMAFVSRMVHPLLIKPFKHPELEKVLWPLLPSV